MPPYRQLLGSVTGLALTALVVIPVTRAVVSSADGDTPHGSVTAAIARNITVPAAQVSQRCHGDDGALIRTHGRIRHVSLARGLRTYQHKAPGTFIALCGTAPATTSQGATPQGS